MNNTQFQTRTRVFLYVIATLVFCGLAVQDGLAQRRPATDGGRGVGTVGAGNNVLYGDVQVSGASAQGSFQVTLYAGLNELGKQVVGNGGRYRFNNLSNGEYDLVVEFENQVIYRRPIRINELMGTGTDIKNDVVLEARVSGGGSVTPAVVSAALAYNRSAENQGFYDRAVAALARKDTAGAISLFEQLLANDPKDFVAWAELGTLYFKDDKFAKAEDAYLRALQAKPDFLLAMLNLGKLQLAQKKYEIAVDVLTKAVTADPQSADAQQYLGEAYLGLKKGSKALGPLNEAIRLDPKGKADIHLRIAALYNAAGMKDKAAVEYEQFLAKRPDYAEKAKLQDYIKANKKP